MQPELREIAHQYCMLLAKQEWLAANVSCRSQECCTLQELCIFFFQTLM